MTECIEHNGHTIVASTDVSLLKREKDKGNTILLIINEDNKSKDTSFARFAVTEDSVIGGTLADCLDDYFLNRIIARSSGDSCTLMETNRLLIREICESDADFIKIIFEQSSGFMEVFFDSQDDLRMILRDYARDIYDFYGYGLWAVCFRDSKELIGLAGLTLRENDMLELGYGMRSEYRHKGYCYEACQAILQYAKENLDYNEIFARVNRKNIPGLGLAEKLGITVNIVGDN